MSFFTPIQILRSLVYNKRPNPSTLLDGQPAFNGNDGQPGLFFKNSNNELVKIGPTFVGSVAPNNPSDPSGQGGGSLCVGESWLDQDNAEGPLLKVWDGSQWVSCSPVTTFARVLISNTAPSTVNNPQGTLWWNPLGTGMKILFDGDWESI
jgi:hypothetical protein